MKTTLEFADIQGNILTAYGRLGFPKARYLLVHVGNAAAGRAFVEALRLRVTTALRWPSARKNLPLGKNPVKRPAVAINIAFTFRGLLALGLPTRTLRDMPHDFIDGMVARRYPGRRRTGQYARLLGPGMAAGQSASAYFADAERTGGAGWQPGAGACGRDRRYHRPDGEIERRYSRRGDFVEWASRAVNRLAGIVSVDAEQ
jgi:hypothetical protein